MDEMPAVAQALGLRDAVSPDGGGSTAMSVAGVLVDHPGDAAGERSVEDALVYLDRP
jgi:exopolysaccharide biosynthesis protein